MRNAKASNWILEQATPLPSGFKLLGTSKGYTSFSRAFEPGDDVFYSARDEMGNREAGWATYDGKDIVGRAPTATLYNNVYTHGSPYKVNFTGNVEIACTFNAAAFNIMWKALQAFDPDGDGEINIPPELIDGLLDALRKKADKVDLEAEVDARIAGDKQLQKQIDNITGHSSNWDSISDKPESISDLGYNNSINGGSYQSAFKEKV